MKLSAILEPMIAAGVSGDVILATVKAFEEQQGVVEEKSKEKARERWRRWKSNQTQTNVGKRLQTTTNDSCEGVARGLDNLQTTEISGQKENKKDAAPKALSDLAAFKADLEQDATPEQVDAFAKHRKAKKGQNSAYSAKLFRRDAADCGLTVSQAIDMAISRGWLTVKPEYLAGRQQSPPRSTAPPSRPRTVAELAIHRLETGQARNEPPDKPDRPLVQSYGSGQAQGSSVLELVAIAANGYRRN